MPALEPRSEQSTAVRFSVAAFQAQVNRAKRSSVAALCIPSTLPILDHLDGTSAIFMCEFSANFSSIQLAKIAIEAHIVLLSPPEIKCLPPSPGHSIGCYYTRSLSPTGKRDIRLQTSLASSPTVLDDDVLALNVPRRLMASHVTVLAAPLAVLCCF